MSQGILRLADLEAVSLQELDIMLKVNVRGVFLAIQAAAYLSEGGRIITVGSNTAVRSGYPGSSVYAMTKAAVAVMVKEIAIDLAPRGITVNNIQPGPTLTDMTADYIDSITAAIPLKRVGDPDEIAGLVAYLASGESGYMTGSSLTIDGGMGL
jgi:3-oxoacyl-[acyl-carrier protein] reductase